MEQPPIEFYNMLLGQFTGIVVGAVGSLGPAVMWLVRLVLACWLLGTVYRKLTGDD